MAKLIKNKTRRLSDTERRAFFEKVALETRRERERTEPKQGQKVYKGKFIRRTPFGKWETPFIKWGDQPGEWHSFRTLKAAKGFIDRNY